MKKLCLGVLALLAVLFLVASIALLAAHVLQDAVGARVKKEVVLKNGTDSFKAWENPPPPIYMQYYFFNVTNPLEVLQGATPIVREVGPYTFRERKPRVDIHFLDNDTEVSSFKPVTYYFVREMSVGDPDVDRIRTVNVPAVTAMNMAAGTPLHFPVQIMLMLYQETMFVTHTVNEWLWGYEDRFLSAVHKLRPSIDPKFGFFYKENGTDDGEYVMQSGEKNYLDFTKIVTWKGKDTVDYWSSPYANMINGTDGSSFHPLISRDETLYAFVSDFCRSIYVTFEQDVTVKGIPAYRFTAPPKFFANISVNPDNAGFCVGGHCLKAGLLNVSACKQGAPIFLSPPHFYLCDELYAKAIDGMHPNKGEHETFLDINALTGVLVRASRRIQVNVYIRKLPDFQLTGNIQDLFFPVFYLNESVLIDKASADKLKLALFESSVVTSIPYIAMTIGIIFGVLFVVLACRPFRTREEGTKDERAPLIRTS
ncbi:lysosome membrane protein 2 [Tiliqua scincoides]|uniref:lysosome membrane protein 2 n=1 Tax=Tiliqua scincoides TaxID=71010 RepID=UPI003462CB35